MQIKSTFLSLVLFVTFFVLKAQPIAGPNNENIAVAIPENIPAMTAAPNDNMPYALIAGGSKGIGFAIAEALARRKYNLVLVARGKEALQKAKDTLEMAYGIKVAVLSYDLSQEASAPAIAQWCRDNHIKLKVLCNVAGLGGDEDYLQVSLDTVRYMVRLNVESCMAMTMELLPLLEQQAPAYILNVSSMAGFAPIPSKNVYSATKSAVLYFSYSLRYQLKKKHISVSCLAPGPVYTKPSIEKTTKEKLGWLGDQMSVKPARVGEIAVKKTLRKKMIIVPGRLAGTFSGVLRILPKRWAAGIYGRLGG